MLGDEKTRKNLRETGWNESDSSLFSSPLGLENREQPGILLYALDYIFKNLSFESTGSKTIHLVQVSYIEIYNDSIYDLLQDKNMLNCQLTINEISHGKFVLKGAIEKSVKNINELLQVIKQGERTRHYAESVMNHNSSRSHTIFQVKLRKMSSDTTFKSEIVFLGENKMLRILWT